MTTQHPHFGATARRDAHIVQLQNRVLDHSGHVRKGQRRDDVRILVDYINWLRDQNGWKPLDMTGRWRRG